MVAFVFCMVPPLQAGPLNAEFALLPGADTCGEWNAFGQAVAIDQDSALVGVPITLTQPIYSGMVLAYRFNGTDWVEVQRLQSDRPAAGESFGHSVALEGEWALIGRDANVTASDRRLAYVFRWTGSAWEQSQILLAPEGSLFRGRTPVTIAGPYAFVGASCAGAGICTGAVHVYRLEEDRWSHSQVLRAGDRQSYDHFGIAVDAHFDAVVIGTAKNTQRQEPSGGAYVFRLHGTYWIEEQQLAAPAGRPGDSFGRKVAVHGDAILVGAPQDDPLSQGTSFTNRGSAYLYQRDGTQWRFRQKLFVLDSRVYRFGDEVALTNEWVMVGAPVSEPGGALFGFRRCGSGLSLDRTWSPQDNPRGAGFGGSIAISEGAALVGAPGMLVACSNPPGPRDGAAYVIGLSRQLDCNANGIDDQMEIESGMSPDCNDNCEPDSCERPPHCARCVDCNGNDRPDDCDIAEGISPDCNEDWVPDECQLHHMCENCGDCNGNSIPDDCDLAAGTDTDCDGNRVPDECQIPPICPDCDCNRNGRPDTCDLASGVAADCNRNRRPDTCDLESGAAADCNGNLVPDSCDVAMQTSTDCDRDRVPDECEVPPLCETCDCNGNGIPDNCDVSADPDSDCNHNRIPDSCEVGPDCDQCLDCNANLMPDACDIAAGISADCSGNGIPDECEWDCDQDAMPDVCLRQSQLLSFDELASIQTGNPLALWGERALIGLYLFDPTQPLKGLASLYRKEGSQWIHEQDLVPEPQQPDPFHRVKVVLAADVAIIGFAVTNENENRSGTVYVFQRDGRKWMQIQRLKSSQPARYDLFGSSLALNEDTLAVGAPAYPSYGGSGVVHLFRKSGSKWVPKQELRLPLRHLAGEFGHAIALSESFCLVGAPSQAEMEHRNAGAVFVFQRVGSRWEYFQMISNPEPRHYARFGQSIALNGNECVIGAHGDAGAYFFEFDGSTWAERNRLSGVGNQRTIGDVAVAMNGNHAILGLGGDFAPPVFRDVFYLFRFDGTNWHKHRRIVPGKPATPHLEGGSVALQDRIALMMGTAGTGTQGQSTGAAYAYDLQTIVFGDWDLDGLLTLRDHAELVRCVAAIQGNPDQVETFGCLGTFDVEEDGDIDLADVADFQRRFGCPSNEQE
jgi:hypothetical protein